MPKSSRWDTLRTLGGGGYLAAILLLVPAKAQMPPAPDTHVIIPRSMPTLTPGMLELVKLEGRFADDVAKGGGRAFASWFADDAVTLNNGQPAILGRTAIAANAQWDPRTYQLTWTPQGVQMGPSGDMGFTWGHYEAQSKDKTGHSVLLTGRYITVWKKTPAGWKVALDASAEEPSSLPMAKP